MAEPGSTEYVDERDDSEGRNFLKGLLRNPDRPHENDDQTRDQELVGNARKYLESFTDPSKRNTDEIDTPLAKRFLKDLLSNVDQGDDDQRRLVRKAQDFLQK